MSDIIERLALSVVFDHEGSDSLADEHLAQTHPELNVPGQAGKRARRWADLADAIDKRAREIAAELYVERKPTPTATMDNSVYETWWTRDRQIAVDIRFDEWAGVEHNDPWMVTGSLWHSGGGFRPQDETTRRAATVSSARRLVNTVALEVAREA